MNANTVSCGVILLDSQARVLLAHATETNHWDIPKGQGEPGEAPIDAALRELREETGIVFAPERLTDLGRFAYRPGKDLHLFAARVADGEVDIAQCVCTSMFRSRTSGSMIPEMDAFKWVTPRMVPRFASRSLARLFATTVSLDELHRVL
jgi:ADP-ribose pyrophosphatase YjhB (NUDIX family)